MVKANVKKSKAQIAKDTKAGIEKNKKNNVVSLLPTVYLPPF